MDTTHCPYRQSSKIQQALASDKMKIGFLLGAGCPLAVQVVDGSGHKPLIPDIVGLTKIVCGKLTEEPDHKPVLDCVCKRLGDSGVSTPNLEDLLSHIRAVAAVVGKGSLDGLTEDSLRATDRRICGVIQEAVCQTLPSAGTPYHALANWIRGIPRRQPIEIFTTNYDLLMEQALEGSQVPYFDGFSGSNRTFFDLASIEQDGLPPRWARVWKLHGSINWRQGADSRVSRGEHIKDDERLLIHPSHLKYDDSRRMPYLAMLDRLRTFLSSGQAVLITCGYSFSDDHLNDVMLQALAGNANAIGFALLYGKRSAYVKAARAGHVCPNLVILAFDGAVIGTREGAWGAEIDLEHPLNGIAVTEEKSPSASAGPPEVLRFRLGDFARLGAFLLRELGSPGAEES